MRTFPLATLVIATGLLATPAVAQVADTTASRTTDRLRPMMGPHRFLPNNLTRDPFPRSYLRSTLGLGEARDLPIVPKFEIAPGDTIGGLTGNLTFATLQFEYQQRVKDWMGFWAEVSVNARLGDDFGALLAEGVNLTTGFEIGWMFRLLQNERFALAATAHVNNSSLTTVNVLEFVQGIIDSVDVPLVQKTPILRGSTGLRLAYAANAWLGLTATGEVGYGESFDRSKGNTTSGKIALAADVDFGPLVNAPVGVVLAGSNTFAPGQAVEYVNRALQGLLRIAYTGRPDFLVALDLQLAEAQVNGSSTSAVTTTVSMRYYF